MHPFLSQSPRRYKFWDIVQDWSSTHPKTRLRLGEERASMEKWNAVPERKEAGQSQKKHGHYKNTGFMVQPQESLKMGKAASKVPKLPVQQIFKYSRGVVA